MTNQKPTKKLDERISEELLGKLQRREITTTQAAARLNVSLTHLSRTLSAAGFRKEPNPATLNRAQASIDYKVRIQQRQDLAKAVFSGAMTMKKACEMGRCSPRTLFRYRQKEAQA